MDSDFGLSDVKLAWGQVRHQRNKPKPNGFNTGACFVRLIFKPNTTPGLPLNPAYHGALPKIDHAGLVSVQAKHYGFEQHAMTLPQLVGSLHTRVSRETGLTLDGEVHLHTFPKVLGYVFNPVSFWYFHNSNNECLSILAEVNNTFGERHFYLLKGPNGEAVNKGITLVAEKVFHVSPFFPVSGYYQFRFMDKIDRSVARIDYYDDKELQLTTSVSGELLAPSVGLWLKTIARFGWSSVNIIVKIHWQAMKLWWKGARFYGKPTPPKEPLTQAKVQV